MPLVSARAVRVLASLPADLGHVIPVSAYRLSASASNIGHVLPVPSHRFASLACDLLLLVGAHCGKAAFLFIRHSQLSLNIKRSSND
jgi:hypothetical protein